MRRIYVLSNLIFMAVLLMCSQSTIKHGSFTGLVEGTKIQIPALTGGKIEFLNIDTGEWVEKESVIALIDTLELFFQKNQLQGNLEELDAQEILAKTNLEKSQTDLKYIQEKYRRFSELLKNESVDQQTVDDLQNRLNIAELNSQAARVQFQALSAKKKQLNAQLRLIEKKISDAKITSPLSGIISEKYYDAGEAIPPLNPIAEIIDLQDVWVKIYVGEMLLPEIILGQEVDVLIDGVEKGLTGKIGWISPKAEFTPKTILTPETRTSLVYAVKIYIPNPDQFLKHGMPVEIKL
jgi:HlyD family secretion protein